MLNTELEPVLNLKLSTHYGLEVAWVVPETDVESTVGLEMIPAPQGDSEH